MSNQATNEMFDSAFSYKVIYAFSIPDEPHRGLIKIGDASLKTETPIDQLPPNCKELNQAAIKRIKEYTNTAGVKFDLLHTELAVRTVTNENGTQLLAFRDHQVHKVLENSRIEKVKIDDTTGNEWYRVDLETAKEAINAVKKNLANLSHSTTTSQTYTPIVFRPEQKEAISLTVKQFKKADKMLWNAKMRFGKTLSALEVIRQSKFKKTIIVTHRPVVNAGWYEDFTKIFSGTGYLYGSKENGYSVSELLDKEAGFVYFASIQDLRGSKTVGGKFDKNSDIFNTIWDCVIVDEAHEGTKTALGDETVKSIVKEDLGKTKFLALSGTPFNIMDQYDQESIYTWDYIMEQESKSQWDKLHFGDSNPYEELPELHIYTYNLGDLLKTESYTSFEDKAFNFHEFFRTWTGDLRYDFVQMPENAKIGDFVHEQDVWSLLNLMTKTDENNSYPFSKDEYRELFKHSLWMVPGVRSARALKELMRKHPVFGSGQFDIINVAGSNDEESSNALDSVKSAISNAEKTGRYTITLSCGKLTTGVTVKEWTAVFMLAGSSSTSAANYLQTIFRVQSPCNKNGKIKENAYVFDFAPDRTLKMVSEAVSISSKAGKTSERNRVILGKFLNYCPVIAISGSKMTEYKADKLLQELKKAYADKVVRNGFDDSKLYNDELLKLQDVDIKQFDELKGILEKTKSIQKSNDINVNDQGLTNEEYEEQEQLKKKPKKELTPEEKARLEELKKKKKLRADAISILRSISIRMPLLIYGADVPYEEEITLDRFVEQVDNASWEEFMPLGVTKALFSKFKKYYDEDIFIAAGRRIRNIAREADTLEPTERVKKIAGLFSNFKNPDKETVLTPWRVVNMHMSDSLGGYDFFDEKHRIELDTPRFVNQGQVTKDTLLNNEAQVLEINSKTGLYPLYVAYSLFRTKCKKYMDTTGQEVTLDKAREIWNNSVQENVFVICKTPMAKQITKRTLVGYSNIKVNAHYFDDLINQTKNKSDKFVDRISKESYWRKEGRRIMHFDAIVGNPPYQLTDGGGDGTSAIPIYHKFVEAAKALQPSYISMIMPARWYSGGKGLDEFRSNMLHDDRLSVIHDYPETSDIFQDINIRGGVCYFLWANNHHGNCKVFNHKGQSLDVTERPLLEDGAATFVRYNKAISILNKVRARKEPTMDTKVSSRLPFGIPSNFQDYKLVPDKAHTIKLYRSERNKNAPKEVYISDRAIEKNIDWKDRRKVLVSKASPGGDEYPHAIITAPILTDTNSVCTETYLIADFVNDEQQGENLISYMKTKFFRFMVSLIKNTQNISKGVFAYTPIQDWNQSWSDEKLYDKYGITSDEIQFIDSMIKPLDIE